jgi:radical SAM protein with 4Fe4S-binding SPASM domain
MTQETHEIYRVNSNLEIVKKNLMETIELKKKTNSKVHIEVGFIVMKHNEHEIDDFIKWAKSIGVDSYNIINPAVRNIEQGKKFLPRNKDRWLYKEEEFKKGKLVRKITPYNDCPWIYYSMVILVNGDVVPCCHDPHGKYVMGNLLKQDLEEIWNGEKYKEFRNRIHTNQKSIDICRLCSGYGIADLKG